MNDYTGILNAISGKLSTIIEILQGKNVENMLEVIMLILCIFLILFAIRGE